jgi:hypothetical protein
MRSHLLVVLIAVASCDRAPAPTPDARGSAGAGPLVRVPERWLIGPEPALDLLRADASEASLRARFGADSVRTDSIYVGDGMSELGTVLFPTDSARRLEIVWQDTIARARPAFVYVTSGHSKWRLYPGVGIGTDLKTIESLNGTGFELAGFAWDYSGTTASFNEGRLDTLWRSPLGLGGSVLLRLDPGGQGPDSVTNRVLGDRVFPSTDPAMQRLNPRVYQMLVRPRL